MAGAERMVPVATRKGFMGGEAEGRSANGEIRQVSRILIYTFVDGAMRTRNKQI